MVPHRVTPMHHLMIMVSGGRRAASLYVRLLAAKPQATAGRRRELQIEAARQRPPAVPRPAHGRCRSRSSASSQRERRPAREVGDPAWDRVLAGSAGRGRRRADVVKYCAVRMEPAAAAALLEDVADRALRSEFKPDDGAGAGVVAEAVGDQSAQRPVITGSGDVMRVTMHFHN